MKRLYPILALLILILAACGSAPTQATIPTPTPTDTPTPDANAGGAAPSATVAGACGSKCGTASTPLAQASPIPAYSGDGSKTTEVFSVSDTWTITWTCDATNNYGVDGELSVIVYDSQNNLLDNLLETCTANMTSKGSSQEHQGGDIYLKIDGSVPWTIQIQDNG